VGRLKSLLILDGAYFSGVIETMQINPTILIVGGFDHLGERLVHHLTQKGYQPRVFIPELDRGKALLQSMIGIGPIDLSTVSNWAGVQAVIYCPPIVSQPELDAFVRRANSELPNSTDRELYDFTQPTPELLAAWQSVNDGVMGGVSSSSLEVVNGRAFFKGIVSIDRGGGFASIRTRNFNPPLDLSNYQGISLRVRGAGQRYKLFLRPSDQWDGLSYAYSFDTSPNAYTDLRIPFRNFVPVQRAKTVSDAPPLDRRQVASIQIMLSKFEYDGSLNPLFRPGEFELELCSIGAYGGKTLPQIVVVAPIANTEGNLSQALGGSVRPHTLLKMGAIVDRPSAHGLDFSLTQDPTGEVSSADLAELCVQILSIPEACHRTITVQEYTPGGAARQSLRF
jgi:Complex I intermediate-associated protein 30 (CIA30)